MMRSRSVSGRTPRKSSESTRRDQREVGFILLGEDRFAVYRQCELPMQAPGSEVCRFEAKGNHFVVYQVTDHRQLDAVAGDDLTARLTGRELEIAVLVAEGYATKNIAHKLTISEWTVATYLRRIFAKLDVESRAAMVYRCAPLINRVVDAKLSTGRLDRSAAQRPQLRAARAKADTRGEVHAGLGNIGRYAKSATSTETS